MDHECRLIPFPLVLPSDHIDPLHSMDTVIDLQPVTFWHGRYVS